MSNIKNEQKETKFDLTKVLDTNSDNKIEKKELEKLGFKVNYKQLEQEIISSNWKNSIPTKYQPEIENKNAEEKKAYIFLFQIWKKILGPKQFEVLSVSLPLNEIIAFLYELAVIEKEKDLLQTATIILTQDEIKELKGILASGVTKFNLKKLKEFIEQQLNENVTSAELIKWTKLEKAFEKEDKNPYEIANNIDQLWYIFLDNNLSNLSKDTLRNMATGFSIALIKIYNESNGKLNFQQFLTPKRLKNLILENNKKSYNIFTQLKNLISIINKEKFTNKWENNKYLMNPENFSQLVYNTLTKWLNKKEISKTLKEWEQNQEIQLNKNQLHQQLQNLYDKAGELIKTEQIESLWILSETGWALKWVKKNIDTIKNKYKYITLKYTDEIINLKKILEWVWLWKLFKELLNSIFKLLWFKNWWEGFEKEAEKKFHYVTDWFKTTLTVENLIKEDNKDLVFAKYFKKHKVQQIKVTGKLSYETLKILAYPALENQQQINQKLQEIFNNKNLESNLKKAWIKPEDFYKKAFKVEEQTSKKDKKEIKVKVGIVDFDYIDKVLKTIYKDQVQQVVQTSKKEEINNYQQAKVSYESLKNHTIKQTIQEIASKTGVPKEIIYAIWVNESNLASLWSNPTRFEKDKYNNFIKQWINPEKAKLLATSYGPFQIMWFNYKACGYNSVEKFVKAMKTTQWQLNAIINFINNNPELKKAMQEKDFHKIAKIYNWPAYQKNQYAEKLAFYTKKYQEQVA